jgi:hypothetical protein
MAREVSFPVRKMVGLSAETGEAINEVRRLLPGFPSESDVLRTLLELGLEHWRKQHEVGSVGDATKSRRQKVRELSSPKPPMKRTKAR